MTFWDTPMWHAYEVAGGVEPGTRSRLLAEAAWSTHVVDLTQPDDVLRSGIRKSYRSGRDSINQVIQRYAITLCQPVDIEAFRWLHLQDAGRVTRPQATWDLMGEWLKSGTGLLVGAAVGSDWRAFAYFEVFDGWSFYGHAASLDRPVQHALIWTAMKALKARGVRTLELGWQGEATDEKGLNLEHFKRGFGGVTVPLSTLYRQAAA